MGYFAKTFRTETSEATLLKKQGQERHSGENGKKDDMQLATTMSTGITSIGLWPHNPNPHPEGLRTKLRGGSRPAGSVGASEHLCSEVSTEDPHPLNTPLKG